jgi:hypothetical protein
LKTRCARSRKGTKKGGTLLAFRGVVLFPAQIVLFVGFGLWMARGRADEFRAWSDETGDFVFEGAFKAISGDTALFMSREGNPIQVPLGKLGRAQRQYVMDIAEERSAGLNPKVRADIAPAVKNAGRDVVHKAATDEAPKPQHGSTERAARSAAGERDVSQSRTWSPRNDKPFDATVLRQEYSKEHRSQCFVFQLPDGGTKTVSLAALSAEQKDLAVSDLRKVRQAKKARSQATNSVVGGTVEGQPQSSLPQQSSPNDAANSGLAGAFGALSQALQATNQAQRDTRAVAGIGVPRADEPEDPKLSYDGQFPKCSFRLRLEECANKTDVESLKLWRMLRLKLASSGLSLNEMDWAEHHFLNKLPTDGFTAVQKIQYHRFLELTAQGY